MHRRVATNSLSAADIKQYTVAVCGNPNCGKTTIFNAITGLRQKVGNYPGVTVDRVSGHFHPGDDRTTRINLVDIPGTYSLAAFSPDEYIAAQALFGSLENEQSLDAVICVIDATNLERGLYLLFQVLQIGLPVVVALNMIDLAGKKGLFIDTPQLSELLGGLPVVDVIGSRRVGIGELKDTVASILRAPHHPAHPDVYPEDLTAAAAQLRERCNGDCLHEAEYLRVILDADGPAEKRFLDRVDADGRAMLEDLRSRITEQHDGLSNAETGNLSRAAEETCARVVQQTSPPRPGLSDRIDRVVLHPVLGPIVLIAVMTIMFQSIFSWAEPVMEFVDGLFGGLAGLVAANMNEGPLQSLITDGIIGGIGSVLIFLPQIMILFLFIAILEDSGYMPRAAFLVDRAFKWCGLSGKSFIPMLSSFACAVPGIMATRTIEDRKLRITTIMVSPLMTCSARLPVYAIMIAAFIPHKVYLGVLNSQGLVLTALYLLGMAVAVVVSFILKKTIFKSESSSFLMELPSYKMPTVSSVVIRVLNRAKSFVVRAGTVIAAITIIVWAMSYYPRPGSVTESFLQQKSSAEESLASIQHDFDQRIDNAVATSSMANQIELQRQFEDLTTDDDVAFLTDQLLAAGPEQQEIVNLMAQRRRTQLAHEAAMSALEVEESGELLRSSYFAQIGRFVEPVFKPLGWDWRITMATLASFPAREVIIATLGTIFNLGADIDIESASLVDKMRRATWTDGDKLGQRLFTPAVALSIMVFFALCCQCGATVVTIRQEAGHWGYAIGTFIYMTILAYIAAFIVYRFVTAVGF